MDLVESILAPLHWAILDKIRRVLEPLQVLQQVLEGEKYFTGSLVIALVMDLRESLHAAIEHCSPSVKKRGRWSGKHGLQRAPAVLPC